MKKELLCTDPKGWRAGAICVAKSNGAIPITGVWLRSHGLNVDVLLKIDGQWRVVFCEFKTGEFSHIRYAEWIRDKHNSPPVEFH